MNDATKRVYTLSLIEFSNTFDKDLHDPELRWFFEFKYWRSSRNQLPL